MILQYADEGLGGNFESLTRLVSGQVEIPMGTAYKTVGKSLGFL